MLKAEVISESHHKYTSSDQVKFKKKIQMSVSLAWPERYYVWAWILNKSVMVLHPISLTKWYEFLFTKLLYFPHRIRGLFLHSSSATGCQKFCTRAKGCPSTAAGLLPPILPVLLPLAQQPGLSHNFKETKWACRVPGAVFKQRNSQRGHRLLQTPAGSINTACKLTKLALGLPGVQQCFGILLYLETRRLHKWSKSRF